MNEKLLGDCGGTVN